MYLISKSPLDWWLNHLTLATGLVWSFQNLLWTVPKMLSQWPFMYGCTRPGVSVDRTVQCLFQNQGNSPCFDSEIVYWAEDACLWVFTLPWISFSCSFCTWPFFCHGNCALALSSPNLHYALVIYHANQILKVDLTMLFVCLGNWVLQILEWRELGCRVSYIADARMCAELPLSTHRSCSYLLCLCFGLPVNETF